MYCLIQIKILLFEKQKNSYCPLLMQGESHVNQSRKINYLKSGKKQQSNICNDSLPHVYNKSESFFFIIDMFQFQKIFIIN